MTKKSILSKLKSSGYVVRFCASGKIIASKYQRTYIGDTLSQLYNQIF
jgi:hypothetical protein